MIICFIPELVWTIVAQHFQQVDAKKKQYCKKKDSLTHQIAQYEGNYPFATLTAQQMAPNAFCFLKYKFIYQ